LNRDGGYGAAKRMPKGLFWSYWGQKQSKLEHRKKGLRIARMGRTDGQSLALILHGCKKTAKIFFGLFFVL
jgi:hypothetical protein